MKGFFFGLGTTLLALSVGLASTMWMLYAPPPAKQPPNAFAKRIEPAAPKRAEPETNGLAASEPRLAAPDPPKSTDISAVQKKRNDASDRMERKREARKNRGARREVAKRRVRDPEAAYEPNGWNAFGQGH